LPALIDCIRLNIIPEFPAPAFADLIGSVVKNPGLNSDGIGSPEKSGYNETAVMAWPGASDIDAHYHLLHLSLENVFIFAEQ
jgi:hypothetical protein